MEGNCLSKGLSGMADSPKPLFPKQAVISLDFRDTFIKQTDMWEMGMKAVMLSEKGTESIFFKSWKTALPESGAIKRNCPGVKCERAVSPNQVVSEPKEIPVYLCLLCLSHYILTPLWIMRAQNSRKTDCSLMLWTLSYVRVSLRVGSSKFTCRWHLWVSGF